MYADNEILFPPYVIHQLGTMRGGPWRVLVEQVALLSEDAPGSLALSLQMIRLNGCMACETDCYRAMRGCEACSRQALRRYRGTDEELLQEYAQALEDVQRYLEKRSSVLETEAPICAVAV